MSTSSHIVRDSLIAMNKGDEVWDVLAPVIFTAGVSAITMATPMLRPNPGAAQISTAIAHSLTLGAPRVGVGLSVAAGFFGKKIYNTFAHYDEVASTENHDWSEALVPFAQGAAELTSAVGLSVAGNFLGRGLGQAVLVPALTVVAGPEIAMAAGPVLGAGLAFFAIKEASSYISDTAHYDFISQQTALNFAGSMLFIGLHPLAYSGMGRLFGTSALSWTTHFQRVFFSGLTANTAVAAVDHAISGTNDFAHTWARDLRASALVNASSILGYAFHRPPNYRPPTSETPLSVEKIGKYTLERTSDPQLATLRQNGYPDISWVVDAKNLPQNPMHSDITPLIKGMKVWSPYRRDFFTVERSAGLTEAEVTNFMRGLNPKLVQQAGGTETVMDIMMGRTPISTVSQYQIRLCFDNFRHALPDMDAIAIYGSGLRSAEQDRFRTPQEMVNIATVEKTDFIGIARNLPDAMWKMGQRHNEAVMSDPSKLVDRGHVVPRSWAQLSAFAKSSYLYVNPDPTTAYTFNLESAPTPATQKGYAKIAMADAQTLDRPGGKANISISDRVSKLDLARPTADGKLQVGRSLVWVNPERKADVLGSLKTFSDKVYNAYLTETLTTTIRPQERTTLAKLIRDYASISYEHEQVRSSFELRKGDKRDKLVENNRESFIPHLTEALNAKIRNREMYVSLGDDNIPKLTTELVNSRAGEMTVHYRNSWSKMTSARYKQAELNGPASTNYLVWWTGNDSVPTATSSQGRLERKTVEKVDDTGSKSALKNFVVPAVALLAKSVKGLLANSRQPNKPNVFDDMFPMREIRGLYPD